MDYHILREFADSWAMLGLFGTFIFVVFWAWRPGSRKTHDDTANIPFRNEDKPASDPVRDRASARDGATL
ncbi:cbb3-type cytochrome c oxidase subunit 3 [Phaeovulum sp. NW3]|uniref:cbb3-type cytochrome oxidase subunit 3 n=1 Tax=Phaeovulum sp. NW3 TaxID=2934933 RepID=UPI0020209E30|nr:cbb3-type cytochrome c oxidase subunit 3 [Phaeovulum sp. NW3]MCL7463517.1 cbb3-type cytochrome c oxidase subunit 3 [Phaeovulum sp. NW3]